MPDETADLKAADRRSLRNKSLDGLRGLAAINVTLGHFFSAFFPALLYKNYPMAYQQGDRSGFWFDVATSAPASLFYNSHFAVVVFFVLSGYVLSAPYYQGQGDMILKQRLIGRYLRLNLPLMVSVILSFMICKAGLYYNVEAARIAGSDMFIGQYFTNNITLSSLFEAATYKALTLGDRTYNHPLWTLRFEFIGSLVLLAFYICKPAARTLLLTAPLSALVYAFLGMESIYLIALFAGAALHLAKFQAKWNWPFMVAGLYFGAFQFSSTLYDFWPAINLGDREIWERGTVYNLIGALLLVAAIANGAMQKFLGSRICQFFGEVSYPIYLLHFLILCSLSSAIYINAPQTGSYLLLNLGIYLAVCLGLGKLFALWVDRPSIRLSRRVAGSLFQGNPLK